MKVLLSADYFYPSQMGGPSNSIYWLAKALQQAGHEVTVVATSQNLPSSVPVDQWVELDCGRVRYTRNPHFYLPIKHIWHGWRTIQKADVVHVNSFFYPASIVWVLMGRLLGKPIVWSPHGELSPAVLFSVRSGLKRLMLSGVKWARPDAWFHAASSLEATCIRQQVGIGVKVFTIPNRLELPIVLQPAPMGRPYLLFMGRLHPIKAIDRLLEALGQSTLFLESDYQLFIAGPETDRAYAQTLRQLVKTLNLSAKVAFIGFVQGDQKQQLYANAHVTILPSHTENFGNVVIESLAQGTPVIASTHTPWQLLDLEQVGNWVANEPDSLRTTIEKYLTMPCVDYQECRKRAVKLAHREFSINRHIQEWERMYEQILHDL